MPIERSPILDLPYIQAAQAQKHVTHNEAVRLLDAAVQLTVQSRSLASPPSSPPEAARFIVASGATGEWAGHSGEIAVHEAGGYWFIAPLAGWQAYVEDEGHVAVFDGTDTWRTPVESDHSLARLGVNAPADGYNRLLVAGDASLFTHDGAGHRIALNKSTAGDTASLLFQTGYSGRAEIGTAGDDALAFRVSDDGSSWADALRIDPSNGEVEIPVGVTGLAVMQSATDVTPGRLMRADYGYGPGNVIGTVSEAAGVPTGAVIETGADANGQFTRFADGTQICSHMLTSSDSASITWSYPAAFVSAPQAVATVQSALPRFASMHSGDAVSTSVDCWTQDGLRAAENVALVATGRWF